MSKISANTADGRLSAQVRRNILCIIGSAGYALGMNMLVLPADVYCGGMLGFCQMFASLFGKLSGIHLNFDLSSVLYYAINVPLVIMAAFSINKSFLFKTVVSVTAMSAGLAFVPIQGFSGVDRLTACILGGIICGVSNGLILRQGASAGGFDVVGLLMVKKRRDASVGRLNMLVNVVFFLCCGFLFSLDTVLYSMIFVAVYSVSLDKTHSQNIAVEVKIITHCGSELEKTIMEKLQRGVTYWDSVGSYTGEGSRVLFVVLSKYELPHLRSIVHQHDAHAFMVINDNVHVDGNFIKKL